MGKRTEIDIEVVVDELKVTDKLADRVDEVLEQSIRDVAHGAYANIISQAQSGLNSTRQDYLKGLSFEKLGTNEYLITLDGKFANMLEEGYAPYNMKDVLLKSDKTVKVGSRAGLPWVQQGKKGKYAHVPIEQKPFSKAPKAADMAELIRGIEVENARGRKQKITSIFKDTTGNPLLGEVARAPRGHKLEGLVKYQHQYKKKVESIYVLYRTISENSTGWRHPGFEGLHAFEKTEAWVRDQIDAILKTILE